MANKTKKQIAAEAKAALAIQKEAATSAAKEILTRLAMSIVSSTAKTIDAAKDKRITFVEAMGIAQSGLTLAVAARSAVKSDLVGYKFSKEDIEAMTDSVVNQIKQTSTTTDDAFIPYIRAAIMLVTTIFVD